MGQIRVRRDTLADMLRGHGEDDLLAERALTPTDDELAGIGTLSAYYAWSEEALGCRAAWGARRAPCRAAVDVLEPSLNRSASAARSGL